MSTSALDEALQLERAGDLDGAVIAIEGILTRTPSHPTALAHLADVQLKRGRLRGGRCARPGRGGGRHHPFHGPMRGDLS